MSRHPDFERKTRDAFRLASDIMMDLISATQTYRIFQHLWGKNRDAVPDNVRVGATRLCLFHALLSLSKWTEVYDRYKDVLPPDTRAYAKQLRKDIEARGIVEFRNKVVGHIWDDETHHALTNREIDQRMAVVAGSDIEEFFSWVNDADGRSGGSSVVQMIEQVRDRVRESYSLTDDDLHR